MHTTYILSFRKSSKKSSSDVAEKGSNASMLNEIWPKPERPQDLQDDSTVNKLPMDTLQSCFRMYLDKVKAEGGGGIGEGIAKDVKHPKVQFKSGSDDRKRKLHKASFLRLPLSDEKYWCEKVPMKRKPIIRALNLAHSGSNNKVSSKTIELLHDRSKPVELKHLTTGSLAVAAKGNAYMVIK